MTVKLWIQNQRIEINLDKTLPHTKERNRPFYLRTSETLWVSYLEKAMAAAFGSYTHLDGLSAPEVVRMITNTPFYELNHPQNSSRSDNLKF